MLVEFLKATKDQLKGAESLKDEVDFEIFDLGEHKN